MKNLLKEYIGRMDLLLPGYAELTPWHITDNIAEIITKLVNALNDEFNIKDDVAIHKTAIIENNAMIKGPAYIGKGVRISANAYLRSGVILDEGVHIGAGCEVKQSIIFANTAVAHFNYIGNSVVGSGVNFEAGSVAANHFNERENKVISVMIGGSPVNTGVTKFGSLVGDGSRIGANAVLSPGTILAKKTVVRRLELIEQVKQI